MIAKVKTAAKEILGLYNEDGWKNVLTGLGNAARDKRLSTTFARNAPLQQSEAEDLFHGDDLIKRICELPPKEMTREWIEIVGDSDSKLGAKLQALDARCKFMTAQTWARLFGGSVLVMVVDDGQAMDQPLDVDKVKDITDLLVLDRYELAIAHRYADPTQPKFEDPEIYEIRTQTTRSGVAIGQAFVHESRCLRFRGTLTTRRKQIENMGWDLSVIDTVHEIVRDFSSAHQGAAILMADYSQAVFKIKGLAGMLASDQDALVLKRIQLMDLARSIARAVILDADGEEFERKATPTGGLPELLDRIAGRLAAAIDMPITILMGESPGGLNASGDADHRHWENTIRAEQEARFREPISRLLAVTAKAIGFVPKDSADGQVHFSFKALHTPTEQEQADTRLKVAQTDSIYHGLGVLDSSEIAVSRFGGDKYSAETSIDQQAPGADAPDVPDDATPDEAQGATKGAPATDNVQATALNGAQAQALQAYLTAVADGSLEPEAAKLAIVLCFPSFDEKKVAAMIGAVKVKEPPPAPPVVAPFAPPKAAPPIPPAA